LWLAKPMSVALQSLAASAAADAGEPLGNGGTQSMSLNTRMEALKERHASLETRIFDEDHRPKPDSDSLTRLKLEKLRVKEEMERLRTLNN
jgi:hypothetical protein